MAWGSGGVGSVPFGSTLPVVKPPTLVAQVLHMLRDSKVLHMLKLSKVTHTIR